MAWILRRFTDRWFHSAVSKTLITWLKIWTRASAKMKPTATKSSTGGKWKTVPVHFHHRRLQQIWWQCRSQIIYAEEFDRCKCFRVSKMWLELTNYEDFASTVLEAIGAFFRRKVAKWCQNAVSRWQEHICWFDFWRRPHGRLQILTASPELWWIVQVVYMDQLLPFIRMLQQRERMKRSEDSRCHQNSWVTRKAWQPVVQVSQVNLKQTNSNLPWMCSWTKREKKWISKRHGFHNYKPL